MILSGCYMNYIIRELSVIRYEIKSKNLIGLTDDNILMQNFMRDMLNMVYGYELINLNEKNPNFPGIDLGDEHKGIGFQITSTKTGQKINDTLEICLRNPCCHSFPHLKVFILTEKQKEYKINCTNDTFIFNPTTDVLDFDDLYIHILSLGNSQRRKLCEFIQSEMPPFLDSFGVDYFNQSDFKRLEIKTTKDDWEIAKDDNGSEYYTFTVTHGFGFTPSNATMLFGITTIVCSPKITETYVKFLSYSKCCFNATIIITS